MDDFMQGLYIYEKQQAAAAFDKSLGFNGILQVLTGKKDGDYANNYLFWFVLGNMMMDPEDWQGDDPVSAAKKAKQFNAAIAAYFLRILSQQEQFTYKKAEIAEPFLLGVLALHGQACHSGLQKALYERGIIDGFRQKILSYTQDDDLLMMALSLFMVYGCRFCDCCPKLEAKDCEMALYVMAQCINRGANGLPAFIRTELLFSLVQIIRVGQRTASLTDAVREGLVKYDLVTTILTRLVPDSSSNLVGFNAGRLITAMVIVLYLPRMIPNVATTDVYLEFALEHFNKRYIMMTENGLKHDEYLMHLHICLEVMGEKIFQEKFLPKLVKVWPQKFLEEVYIIDRSSPDAYERSLVSFISAATLLDQTGRFHGHQRLASIVVDLFLTGQPWVMFSAFVFLQKTYRFPEFNPEALKKVRGCTEELLNDIYSVLSAEISLTADEGKDPALVFDLREKQRSGRIKLIMTSIMNLCLKCKSKYPAASVCKACGPGTDGVQIVKDIFIRVVSYRKSEPKTKESKSIPIASEVKAASRPNGSNKSTSKPEANSGLSKEDDKNATFLFTCNSCGLHGNNLLMCGRCQSVYYCNQDCQRADWKKGHKQACKPL